MSDGVAHPPDEVVPSLGHGDLEPGLRRESIEHVDARRARLPVVEAHAAAEPRDRLLAGRPAHLGMVDPRHGVSRVHERRRERAVVREEEEPGRVQIEPPDRVEPLAGAPDEIAHRRPALGIVERAHDAARLVEDDRPPPAHAHGLPVDRDPVAGRVGATPELADRLVVHGDAARGDEGLGLAARGDARRAQDLLEALRRRPTTPPRTAATRGSPARPPA
jgi:hypothetical protein